MSDSDAIDSLSFYKRNTVNGKTVLEHRSVAEKMIGRPLNSTEVVHHIDEDKFNNSPDNLMVMRSQADHGRIHKGIEAHYCPINKHWICKPLLEDAFCIDCSKQVSAKARTKRCMGCSTKYRRSRIISKRRLIKLLLDNKGVFEHASREYGLSSNALRKSCKIHGISFRAKYWKNIVKGKDAA